MGTKLRACFRSTLTLNITLTKNFALTPYGDYFETGSKRHNEASSLRPAFASAHCIR